MFGSSCCFIYVICVYLRVQHILYCVFVLFFFVLCTLCCQFLSIVNFWLPLWYSLNVTVYEKKFIKRDGQLFHQYQQKEQSPLSLTHWTQKDHDIWRWKSRTWLRTGRKMWRDVTGKYDPNRLLLIADHYY